MDLDVAAQRDRTAGTDAERRAARALARALRQIPGRDAHLEAFRTRPGWQLVLALCAALGVAGSVASVDHPIVGTALVGVGLLLALLDRTPLLGLRRLFPSRATQNVVSAAPRAGRVTLVLTAAIDAPRRGIVRALRYPDELGLAALLLVTVFSALRIGGAEGLVLGAAQLLPTTVLVLLVGGWIDEGLSRAGRDGSAAAAVLALTRALDAQPPRNLGVEVALAGAGAVRAHGLRRRLRADGRRAEDLAILHLEPCGAGSPVWLEPSHPQLARAARAAAQRLPGARGVRGSVPALRVARRGRRPALALATRGATPSGAVTAEATVAFALVLVAALDDELGR